MLKELRDFAIKANATDLMIVATVGAALGIIVTSLVDDVLVSVVGLVLGRVDLSYLFLVLSNPNSVAVTSLDASLTIGLFINAVVKFVIVAFVLFLVVKGINAIRKQQAAA
jgi:large conductance mechanosensitive channel